MRRVQRDVYGGLCGEEFFLRIARIVDRSDGVVGHVRDVGHATLHCRGGGSDEVLFVGLRTAGVLARVNVQVPEAGKEDTAAQIEIAVARRRANVCDEAGGRVHLHGAIELAVMVRDSSFQSQCALSHPWQPCAPPVCSSRARARGLGGVVAKEDGARRAEDEPLAARVQPGTDQLCDIATLRADARHQEGEVRRDTADGAHLARPGSRL